MIISANAVMTSSYDYGEVARSIVIAFAASYAALDLAERVTASASLRTRPPWLIGGATAMGIGIWAMHFKGMLAFRLPVPVAYHWPTVLVSLVVAVCASAVALSIASRHEMRPVQVLIGSLIMGGGIAAMHYIGMAAMRMAAVASFSPLLVVLSILLAVGFSSAALLLLFDFRARIQGPTLRKVGAAVVMGAAISAMHYTGMAAATFVASALPPNLSQAVNISAVGNNAVVLVTFLVIGAAILTSTIDRQAEAKLERHVIERTLQLEEVIQALRKEIVERMRAEEALQRSEDHLRLVVDTTPALLHSARPDGDLDFFNKRWLEYVGLSLDDMCGWRWTRVIHPDDIEEQVGKWRLSLATGEPFEAEARVRRADGEYRWMLHRKVAAREDRGNVVKWYGSAVDIHDRKQAEDAVRRSEDEIRLVIDTLPALVWSKLPDGSADFFNQRFRQYTGLPLEEGMGTGWLNAVHPEDRPPFEEEWRTALAVGSPFDMEARLRRADGEYRWVLLRAVPLRDELGRIVKWYGTTTDVEDRKQAEWALQEAHAVLSHVERVTTMGELVATIAHEINQPISAIVTNANFCLRQLASANLNSDKLREAISEIVNDGTRASAVISRVRALLQKRAPERVAVDINQIIHEVTVLLRNELVRSSVTLQADLGTDLPYVSGDRVLLQQVLINLVMNGIEAMHSNTRRARHLLIKSARNQSEVWVQVKDSGTGFDPQQAEHIFEPFFTTKPEGIGMGLAISRSIVESHGGRLWAESGPAGALFQFTLPPSSDGGNGGS